jgi:hypothetical protein
MGSRGQSTTKTGCREEFIRAAGGFAGADRYRFDCSCCQAYIGQTRRVKMRGPSKPMPARSNASRVFDGCVQRFSGFRTAVLDKTLKWKYSTDFTQVEGRARFARFRSGATAAVTANI